MKGKDDERGRLPTRLEEAARRALDALRASRAKSGEVFLERSTKHKAVVKGGALENLERSDSFGAGIRVLSSHCSDSPCGGRGERCGFSSTSDLSKEGLREGIELALKSAALSERAGDVAFQTSLTPWENLEAEADDFGNISDEERVRLALEISDAAYGSGDAVVHVDAHYADWSIESVVATTDGFFGASRLTSAYGTCEAVSQKGTEKQTASEMDFSRRLARFPARAIGRDAARKAMEKMSPRSFPTGRARVVFAPWETASLMDVLERALCADNVLKGKSRFEELGEKIASPLVTLIETPRDARGPSPSAMDDEGTPTRRVVLVRNGELTAFLHDLRTARQMGAAAGNAFRGGFGAPPRPASSQMRLEEGTLDFPSLLREAGEGLYVEELMGLHTVDAVSGEFSLGASGRAIRGGELAESVAGVAVAGNLFELVKNISAVGSDSRFFPSGKETPSLLVEGLMVSGGGEA